MTHFIPIREAVQKTMKNEFIKGFYAMHIARGTGQDLKNVLVELDKLIEKGVLKKNYEIICPNMVCERKVAETEAMEELKDDLHCPFCGEEFEKNNVKPEVLYVKGSKNI